MNLRHFVGVCSRGQRSRRYGPGRRPDGAVHPLSEILASGPTFVDLGPDSVTVELETKVPVVCAVVYGTTAAYGGIATDSDMAGGAHTMHHPTLRGLKPGTTYLLRMQGVGPDGTLYVSDSFTLRTPPRRWPSARKTGRRKHRTRVGRRAGQRRQQQLRRWRPHVRIRRQQGDRRRSGDGVVVRRRRRQGVDRDRPRQATGARRARLLHPHHGHDGADRQLPGADRQGRAAWPVRHPRRQVDLLFPDRDHRPHAPLRGAEVERRQHRRVRDRGVRGDNPSTVGSDSSLPVPSVGLGRAASRLDQRSKTLPLRSTIFTMWPPALPSRLGLKVTL